MDDVKTRILKGMMNNGSKNKRRNHGNYKDSSW